jgi:asparagine synthase (glutamine-hydrolysing)
MSAIFGLFHLDGQPVATRDLGLISSALAPHGPDRDGIHTADHVGLGQRLLSFTPADLLERQPLSDAEGNFVLVVDGRIDNRAELIRELRIPSREAREMPDSAFILRAYQTWELECCSHLVGDFVFAVWDKRKAHLLIARAGMSKRPLYCHAASKVFAFASMPHGLFAVAGIPREIDRQSLADYLALAPRDVGRSLYAGISELPDGYAIVIRREGFRLYRHWRPELSKDIRLTRDDDYVEAFNALLERVVADHLRSLTPVGVMLSGGLDSSAVAATAAHLLAAKGKRLATFTEVPRKGFSLPLDHDRYADESPLVQAIARQCGAIDLNFVHTGDRFFLDGVDSLFCAVEGPFRAAWNRTWWEAILQQAKDQNVRVLLTGLPGNMTMSQEGAGVIPQLIRKGQLIRAFREASFEIGTLARGAAPLLPDSLWLTAGRLVRNGNPIFAAPDPWRAWSPIHPEFAERHRVRERARAKEHDFYFRRGRETPAQRYEAVRRWGAETPVVSGLASLYGVQTRDPAGDTRIVEFAMSIPEEQHRHNGVPRSLIRRAMADRLPQEVLTNHRRGLQTADWFEQAAANQTLMLDELALIEKNDLAREAMDLEAARRLLNRIPDIVAKRAVVPLNYRAIIGSTLMTGSFLRWVGTEDNRN